MLILRTYTTAVLRSLLEIGLSREELKVILNSARKRIANPGEWNLHDWDKDDYLQDSYSADLSNMDSKRKLPIPTPVNARLWLGFCESIVTRDPSKLIPSFTDRESLSLRLRLKMISLKVPDGLTINNELPIDLAIQSLHGIPALIAAELVADLNESSSDSVFDDSKFTSESGFYMFCNAPYEDATPREKLYFARLNAALLILSRVTGMPDRETRSTVFNVFKNDLFATRSLTMLSTALAWLILVAVIDEL